MFRDDNPWMVSVLTFLTLAATILLFALWPDFPENAQSYLCDAKSCNAQAWLGALSGYVALLAAVIGLWITWGQLAEQRKQTSFLLGESPPTIELMETSSRIRPAMFQVLNWNRRVLVMQGFSFERRGETKISMPTPLSVALQFQDDTPKEFIVLALKDGKLAIGQAFPGWLDRQRAPPAVHLHFEFAPDAFKDFPKDYFGVYDLQIHCSTDDDRVGRARFPITRLVTLNQICHPDAREHIASNS